MIRIYGTLGPACADVDTLAEMLRLGLTGMRLNLSHVTLPRRRRRSKPSAGRRSAPA